MSQLGSMGFLTYGYPYDYWKYEAEDMHKIFPSLKYWFSRKIL